MKPVRDLDYKLVDVLNALLDTGVVINADVVITVSGIPLIGINLRAALAGMATMLDYGLMEAWDESIRRYYAKEIEERRLPLIKDEKIIFSTFGSHYYNQGIYKTWRQGTIYLTDKRLILFRKEPREILFETQIEKIRGLVIQKEDCFGKERDELYVWLENGKAILHANNIEELKSEIEKRMSAIGVVPRHDFPAELVSRSSSSNEKLIQEEKLWYLSSASDIIGETWLPGYMYVTDEQVYWAYQSDGKVLFDIPVKNVTTIEVDEIETYITRIPTKHKILKISYKDPEGEAIALFSGEELKVRRIKSAMENVNNSLL